MKSSLLTLLIASVISPIVLADSVMPAHQRDNPWYQDAVKQLAKKPKINPQHKAKNVILFLGDGMGVSTVTAARILAGQRQGKLGEEALLSFEQFPFTGLSKTYNVNAQTPDSAGTMTAIVSGVKTDAGVLGVDERIIRNDCSTVPGTELMTIMELATLAGKQTGIVTNMRVTHATPGALYAKSPNRDWEDDSAIPNVPENQGCKDIALQLLEYESRMKQQHPANQQIDGIDVVMGGGRRHFLPALASANSADTDKKIEGRRQDGRNLITEWQQQYPTGKYIIDQAGFDALDANNPGKVLALFNSSHMRYEADRHNDKAGEPSLSEMTDKAIDLLQSGDNGYFLMVEGGQIDSAHHAGNAYNALNETVEFSRAVSTALAKTNPEETLILVTADHSHVFTFGGYAKRGNPVLGKVIRYEETDYAKDVNGLPYTAVNYANGLGYQNYGDNTNADKRYADKPVAGRQDLTKVDTEAPGFHQETLVPLEWETHGGEDVSIYAIGPGAEAVSGVNEQNVIFHILNQAADLTGLAARYSSSNQ